MPTVETAEVRTQSIQVLWLRAAMQPMINPST